MTPRSQRYTRESVERALDHHKRAENILDWRNGTADGTGTYRVTMSDGIVADLTTLHAAYGCAMGLASASKAEQKAAGFDMTYAVESKSSSAMVCEEQSGQLPPYVDWEAGRDWYKY